MYGMTPFGRTGFDLFNLFNDYDSCNAPAGGFRTDIKDTGDKFVMESELPGFEKEDITLDINGGYLVISAEHKTESENKDEDGKYIRRERTFGSYKRSFDLTDIDTEGMSAEYKNGILKIDLPKKKPETLTVKRLEIK